MNQPNIYNYSDAALTGSALSVLMRKVYLWMAFALVVTGITAYGVASSPAILGMIFSSQLTFWGIIIAEFALVWYLSSRIQQLSLTTGTLLFIAYSALNGVTLSSIFLLYAMDTITQVFFITAGTFAVVSVLGYTTKMDLSKMGTILIMALIGLVIATVVNIFVASSGLSMIISYAGVIIFVGLTAWETQQIKAMLSMQEYADENAQKLALWGALSLYLDFINLFIYLLRIFGRRD